MSKTGKDYKLRELTDFDNIKNEDIKKLAILVCIHDSYLNGLIMEKDRVESKEYKKELKALIKESKKHSKKINKKVASNATFLFISGRGERIRTFDILVPNQALYQTELHPETKSIITTFF